MLIQSYRGKTLGVRLDSSPLVLRKAKIKLAKKFNLSYHFFDDLISFNNKRFKEFISDNYLKELTISETTESTSVASYLDLLESTIRSLQSVGTTSESYESFVAPFFMSKLPNELRLDINKKLPVFETSEKEWKFEQLLDAFRKKLQLREKCNFVPSSLNKGDRSSSLRQRSFQPPTAATIYTENQEKHDRFARWCVSCKGKHRANRCNVVTPQGKDY